jgi:hypothetical protein
MVGEDLGMKNWEKKEEGGRNAEARIENRRISIKPA